MVYSSAAPTPRTPRGTVREYLDLQDILEEELSCIEESRSDRAEDGDDGVRFSVAFSGGGMRAAAFQAGVLWRLAESNRLKDVEYLTAVSGGGYIAAAFASHCLGAGLGPESAGDVKAWYLDVVAKTICRMQRNAGNFVRDCVKFPGIDEDGAGCLPRALDILPLLITVFLTVCVIPLFFFVCIVVPFVLSTELFFGSALRASFCASPPDLGWVQTIFKHMDKLKQWSPYTKLRMVLIGCIVGTSVLHIIWKALPCCRWRPHQRPSKRPEATFCYLFGYASVNFLRRFVVVLLIMVAFLHMAPVDVASIYSHSETKQLCRDYAVSKRNTNHSERYGGCSEPYGQVPWWNLTKDNSTDYDYINQKEMKTATDGSDPHDKTVWRVFWAFLILATGALIITPICGAWLFKMLLKLVGPIFVIVAMLAILSFRVFGPITHNKSGTKEFDSKEWELHVRVALVACIVILPFLPELRAMFHYYYRRSLCGNYFFRGKDVRIADLVTQPYCPFVLMTGTVCDFKPPGETDSISEISFSALHTGGLETGYVHQDPFLNLGTCTALTGAGCLDAISLTMSDLMSLRFWLEVLNLSWGDFIFFEPEGSWARKVERLDGIKGFLAARVSRALGFLPLMLVYGFFFMGWSKTRGKGPDCAGARWWFQVAIALSTIILACSFYTYIPGCSLLTRSPLIRRIHQLSMYFYRGNHPPSMLYVTDGGVKDCTSIVQLLMRRRERILLVLAAADPKDELKVLKAALNEARSLELATFYDPKDPRKHLDLLFQEYKEDKDMPYLRLAISYCWAEGDEGPKTGHLFIVKNRLPNRCAAQPVKPHVMEDEVRGKVSLECDDAHCMKWKGLTTDALGPFGCCDCCHTRGLNCGPTFPHGAFTGYLYLTPQWCNSLIRLGYEVSADAVDDITNPKNPAEEWEAHVSP